MWYGAANEVFARDAIELSEVSKATTEPFEADLGASLYASNYIIYELDEFVKPQFITSTIIAVVGVAVLRKVTSARLFGVNEVAEVNKSWFCAELAENWMFCANMSTTHPDHRALTFWSCRLCLGCKRGLETHCSADFRLAATRPDHRVWDEDQGLHRGYWNFH